MPFVIVTKIESIAEAYKKACLDFWCVDIVVHSGRIWQFPKPPAWKRTNRKGLGYFAKCFGESGQV